jgi:hypothetical protein
VRLRINGNGHKIKETRDHGCGFSLLFETEDLKLMIFQEGYDLRPQTGKVDNPFLAFSDEEKVGLDKQVEFRLPALIDRDFRILREAHPRQTEHRFHHFA